MTAWHPWTVLACLATLSACLPDRKPTERSPQRTVSPLIPKTLPIGKTEEQGGEGENNELLRTTLNTPLSDQELTEAEKECTENGNQSDCIRVADHWIQKGDKNKSFQFYDLACTSFLKKGSPLIGSVTGCQEARNNSPTNRKAEYDVLACYTNNSSDHCQELCAKELGFSSGAAFVKQQDTLPPWWAVEKWVPGTSAFKSSTEANGECLPAGAVWIPAEQQNLIESWRSQCGDNPSATVCATIAAAMARRAGTVSGPAGLTATKCTAWYSERSCLAGRDYSANCAMSARFYGSNIGDPFGAEQSPRAAYFGCLASLSEIWKSKGYNVKIPWRSLAGRSITELKCLSDADKLKDGFATACPKIRGHLHPTSP